MNGREILFSKHLSPIQITNNKLNKLHNICLTSDPGRIYINLHKKIKQLNYEIILSNDRPDYLIRYHLFGM